MDVESFLIDVTSKDIAQPLSLKQFACCLEKEEKLE